MTLNFFFYDFMVSLLSLPSSAHLANARSRKKRIDAALQHRRSLRLPSAAVHHSVATSVQVQKEMTLCTLYIMKSEGRIDRGGKGGGVGRTD